MLHSYLVVMRMQLLVSFHEVNQELGLILNVCSFCLQDFWSILLVALLLEIEEPYNDSKRRQVMSI
jgi:hypothetical protein